MKPENTNYLRELVRSATGIVLEVEKEYLLEARLSPVAHREGLGDVESLVEMLRMNPDGVLRDMVLDAMTTNETSFFRDLHPFDALRQTILPQLMERRAETRTLNIWSAVCSSGQEPYSLLMMLSENFPELSSWNLNFLASDVSTSMIERARAGRYSQFEVSRGLPASFLVKYLSKVGQSWEMDAGLRKAVKFQVLNLVQPWPALPTMDIIMMRNVLIYFDNATKEKILRKACGCLRGDGYLFLGSSEVLMGLDVALQRTSIDGSWCYQPESRTPAVP